MIELLRHMKITVIYIISDVCVWIMNGCRNQTHERLVQTLATADRRSRSFMYIGLILYSPADHEGGEMPCIFTASAAGVIMAELQYN